MKGWLLLMGVSLGAVYWLLAVRTILGAAAVLEKSAVMSILQRRISVRVWVLVLRRLVLLFFHTVPALGQMQERSV